MTVPEVINAIATVCAGLLQGASPAVTVEYVGDGELRVTQGEVTIYRKE